MTEREELARAVSEVLLGKPLDPPGQRDFAIADAILALGFHRTPAVTDEQVKRLEKIYEQVRIAELEAKLAAQPSTETR